jgi:hypothetical protein
MCVYNDCVYSCQNKKEHHARYANMRRNKYLEKHVDKVIVTKSSKVNWNIANELKLEDKTIVRKRIKERKDIDNYKEI